MDEGAVAAQIVQTTIQAGAEIIPLAARMTKGGVELFVKMAAYIDDYFKNQGYQKELADMLKKYGANLKVFQYDEREDDKVKNLFRAYGIEFANAPDLNLRDGKKEVFFAPEAADRVNHLIERTHIGMPITHEEYDRNADPAVTERILKNAAKNNPPIVSEEADVADIYRLSDYQKCLADPDKRLIEVPADCVREENGRLIIRLPASQTGQIIAERDGIYPFVQGGETQSYFCFLERKREYEVYDRDGAVMEIKSADELYTDEFMKWTMSAYRDVAQSAGRKEYLSQLDNRIREAEEEAESGTPENEKRSGNGENIALAQLRKMTEERAKKSDRAEGEKTTDPKPDRTRGAKKQQSWNAENMTLEELRKMAAERAKKAEKAVKK